MLEKIKYCPLCLFLIVLSNFWNLTWVAPFKKTSYLAAIPNENKIHSTEVNYVFNAGTDPLWESLAKKTELGKAGDLLSTLQKSLEVKLLINDAKIEALKVDLDLKNTIRKAELDLNKKIDEATAYREAEIKEAEQKLKDFQNQLKDAEKALENSRKKSEQTLSKFTLEVNRDADRIINKISNWCKQNETITKNACEKQIKDLDDFMVNLREETENSKKEAQDYKVSSLEAILDWEHYKSFNPDMTEKQEKILEEKYITALELTQSYSIATNKAIDLTRELEQAEEDYSKYTFLVEVQCQASLKSFYDHMQSVRESQLEIVENAINKKVQSLNECLKSYETAVSDAELQLTEVTNETNKIIDMSNVLLQQHINSLSKSLESYVANENKKANIYIHKLFEDVESLILEQV